MGGRVGVIAITAVFVSVVCSKLPTAAFFRGRFSVRISGPVGAGPAVYDAYEQPDPMLRAAKDRIESSSRFA